MKKINKIINIALIFMLIGAGVCQNFIYAAEYSLRVPLGVDTERAWAIIRTRFNYKRIGKNDEALIKKIVTMDALGLNTNDEEGRKELIMEIKEIFYKSLKLSIVINRKTSELAGYLLYRPMDKNTVYINNLFVIPKYQRRGIDVLMLKYCMKRFNSIEIHWKSDKLPDRAEIYENFLALLTDKLHFKEKYRDCFVWEKLPQSEQTLVSGQSIQMRGKRTLGQNI